MVGREAEYLVLLERAHRAHLDCGQPLAALRCAFWIGVTLAERGRDRPRERLARARPAGARREGGDRVERGYLLLPVVFEQEASGDLEAAAATAGEAAAIGERFGDSDLFALAAHEQGHVLIRLGRIKEGLRLLDEAMVAVTAGELSPIVSGIVYCGVILACQDAYEVRRAQEWTAALSDWCERQPDLVAFTGRCLIHRAELMQLRGAWPEALEEARRADERCLPGRRTRRRPARPRYRQGRDPPPARRVRARPRRPTARRAGAGGSRSRAWPCCGWRRGRLDAAAAAIRRAVARDRPSRSARARLLPAYVEIMLAAGDLDGGARRVQRAGVARRGSRERTRSERWRRRRGARSSWPRATPAAALVSLRHAAEVWQELEAPYEAARVRELVGLACRALGDEDTAALELDAARAAFAELGATPDLARLDSRARAPRPTTPTASRERELEVLRLVAAGETNKAIAAELVLSERTVDRHVSNIFAKLRRLLARRGHRLRLRARLV